MNSEIDQIKKDYSKFISQQLYEKFKGIKCDLIYQSGSGDFLTAVTEGEEVRALDLVGGFGSTFLGHNHPELKAEITNHLKEDVPFSSQASIKKYPTRLAKKLSELGAASFKKEFISIFSNSGAETIEAALKHALYTQKKQVDEIFTSNEKISGKFPVSPGISDNLPSEIKNTELINSEDLKINIHRINESISQKEMSVLSWQGSYHGKSLGSVNITHNLEYRQNFQVMKFKTIFLDGSIKNLEKILQDNFKYFYKIILKDSNTLSIQKIPFYTIIACFYEPIQGEGGIRNPEIETIKYLQQLENRNFPLVADEIQSGMGRTGKWFAAEHFNLSPDYITLSKSLGGGLTKIGALMIERNKFEEDFPLLHSSTFSEDELSSRVALKTIHLIERNGSHVMIQASEKGEQLKEKLNSVRLKYPSIIKEIRGIGLMMGVEFILPETGNNKFLKAIIKEDQYGFILSGLFLKMHRIRIFPTISQPNVLRIEPSYNIGYEQLDYIKDSFSEVCEYIQKSFH